MVGCPQCPTDVGHLIGTASNWLQLTLQYHLSILENVLTTYLMATWPSGRNLWVLLDYPEHFEMGTLGITVTNAGDAARFRQMSREAHL